MAVSEAPRQIDLDRCVHCGLCLNACPTYRELGLEMDSPRGRIYQMVQVSEGRMEITPAYVGHIELCLACRSCESACPSGVQYGRLVEAARAQIEDKVIRPWHVQAVRWFVFTRLLVSPVLLRVAGTLLFLYEASGFQRFLRNSKLLKLFGDLEALEQLTPPAQPPFFFRNIGKVFPAEGERRYRVAFLAGCIANVCFARLNEATVRVLQKNGCEVHIPEGQNCCGALHVHAGLKEDARILARFNIDAMLAGDYDAIITNAAGCGSTLKEYDHLLADDPEYAERAGAFAARMRDALEFLASIELNTQMGNLPLTVTYQDSCHLAHGQKIRAAPRKLLAAIPGLEFREMPLADLCCGSAGIYNVLHREMASGVLAKKMQMAGGAGADVLSTANPGCMIQLQAGARLHGTGQRVAHVIELLDEAYAKARG